jgi:hypothetical protein
MWFSLRYARMELQGFESGCNSTLPCRAVDSSAVIRKLALRTDKRERQDPQRR